MFSVIIRQSYLSLTFAVFLAWAVAQSDFALQVALSFAFRIQVANSAAFVILHFDKMRALNKFLWSNFSGSPSTHILLVHIFFWRRAISIQKFFAGKRITRASV